MRKLQLQPRSSVTNGHLCCRGMGPCSSKARTTASLSQHTGKETSTKVASKALSRVGRGRLHKVCCFPTSGLRKLCAKSVKYMKTSCTLASSVARGYAFQLRPRNETREAPPNVVLTSTKTQSERPSVPTRTRHNKMFPWGQAAGRIRHCHSMYV